MGGLPVLRLSGFILLAVAMPDVAREAYACSCRSGLPICETFWKTPLSLTLVPPRQQRR